MPLPWMIKSRKKPVSVPQPAQSTQAVLPSQPAVPSLPALAPPPPDYPKFKRDPLIGRTQNLGTTKLVSPELFSGAKLLLGN